MIFDELNTAFRWYSLLSRQNRFKNQCAAMCDFALPSVCNDLLPFQIKTSSFGTPTVWKLIYIDGTISIPEKLARQTFTLSGGAGNLSISVSGYGIIKTQTWAGSIQSTIDAFVNTLSFGFTAERTGNSFDLIAPSGTGASINGTGISVSTNGALTCTPSLDVFASGEDESTGNILDISSCVEHINKYTSPDSSIYLTYNGSSISNCIPKQFDCGKWYSTIEDENGIIFYSEIFEVLKIEDADTIFPDLDPSLFSAWRFYDDIEKQTRYKSNCENACDFYLQCDKSRLLPFMFRSASVGNIQSFKLIGVDEDCETDIEINLLNKISYLGYDYIYHNGESIDNLPCGKFYVQICDETQCWYSELIDLVDLSAVSTLEFLARDNGDILIDGYGTGLVVD